MDPSILPDLVTTFGPVGALAIYLIWSTRQAKPAPPPDPHAEWRRELSDDIAAIRETLAILKDRSESGRR